MSNGVNKVITVVGARNKGKTTLLKERVIKPSTLPTTLIVDTFDTPVWRTMHTHISPNGAETVIPFVAPEELKGFDKPGIFRTYSSDPDELFSIIQRYCSNMLLIFEDATRYFDGQSKLPKDVRAFILDSKQKNINVVFVFHALIDVPRDIIKYGDFIVLLKTQDPEVPTKWKALPDVAKAYEALKEHPDNYISVTLQIN